MMEKYQVLKGYFGYSSFREGQESLIDAILSGRDAFGIMPTGGGKSICYQVPALVLDGITVVISPLISLMKDQVMALKEVNVSAAYLNSSLTFSQSLKVYENLRLLKYKIVYVAPERLEVEAFVSLCRELPISLVAVDEAHCVSQWGNEFRPSYLKIQDFVKALPKRPTVAAFTATATERVRADIVDKLALRSPLCKVTGFDRPNLKFEVRHPKSKNDTLYALIRARMGDSGIVYCQTRATVEKVCDFLQLKGISATRYHAGLDEKERAKNQDDFVYDRERVMVATNAFGMGIDKSNVSFVIHYNMPLSLEAYYQEAGRAGRDGSSAECILLYAKSDIEMAKFLIDQSDGRREMDEAERERVKRLEYHRLDRMIAYAKSTTCLRGMLLGYFGQEHADVCGNCSNCQTVYRERDITESAQKVLSSVKRVETHLGYAVGITQNVSVLIGSQDKKLLAKKLHTVKTYGIMKGMSREELAKIFEYLIDLGYLVQKGEYNVLSVSATAEPVLRGHRSVTMKYREIPSSPKKKKEKSHYHEPMDDLTGLSGRDLELLRRLRSLRMELAVEENVPAYVIFSNMTLVDMVRKKPITSAAILDVAGVGLIKAERYGDLFMAEIRDFLENG